MKSTFSIWFNQQFGKRRKLLNKTDDAIRVAIDIGRIAEHEWNQRMRWDFEFRAAHYTWEALHHLKADNKTCSTKNVETMTQIITDEDIEKAETALGFFKDGWTAFSSEKDFFHEFLPRILKAYKEQRKEIEHLQDILRVDASGQNVYVEACNEISKKDRIIEIMKDAIEFYSDKETWLPSRDERTGDVIAFTDRGHEARQCLEEIEKIK